MEIALHAQQERAGNKTRPRASLSPLVLRDNICLTLTSKFHRTATGRPDNHTNKMHHKRQNRFWKYPVEVPVSLLPWQALALSLPHFSEAVHSWGQQLNAQPPARPKQNSYERRNGGNSYTADRMHVPSLSRGHRTKTVSLSMMMSMFMELGLLLACLNFWKSNIQLKDSQIRNVTHTRQISQNILQYAWDTKIMQLWNRILTQALFLN